MKWDELADQQCSVARTSAVVGDRWTLLILSDCFLGVRRFEDFQERLRVSRTTLAQRLKLLEKHEVLVRHQYQSNPPRYEYRLTSKGRELFPVISTLVSWGDKYYSDSAGPPILRRHTLCGHDTQPVLSCSHCAEPVEVSDVRARKRPDREGHAPVARGPVKARSS